MSSISGKHTVDGSSILSSQPFRSRGNAIPREEESCARATCRRRSSFFIAVVAFFGQARPAAALPSGIKGWCTVVAPGTEECGFVSALQACKRQHAVYAPTAIFYGTAPLNTKWYVRVCRWSSGIGIILPTNVTMKCTNTALKPDGPWGCALPPQDDCDKNKQGTPTGSTPNPIDLVSGTKRFRAVDFETADGALRLVRSYSSLPWAGTPSKLASVPQGLANWQFDFQVELQIGEGWEASKTVAIALPNGTAVSFARQTNGTMATYTPAAYPRPQTDYTLTFNG
ncbi:MAG: hypothetical protein ABL996_27065, partial [Micropepsaceae bacterium]